MWALFKTHFKTILLTRLRTELLNIREMKISAPMRDHLTPIRTASRKNSMFKGVFSRFGTIWIPYFYWRIIWIPFYKTLHTETAGSLVDHQWEVAEKAMAPHSSTLAWKIPWMEEPGRLQSMGSLRVWHNWAMSLSLFTFMHWRRKWQPTPVFLPGESQGWGSLVGCRLWGRTESNTTEAT